MFRFVWWFAFGSQHNCASGVLAKHANSAANTLTEFHVCLSFALSQMTCNFIAENAVELIQLIGAASAVLSVFLSLSLPGFFLSLSLSLSLSLYPPDELSSNSAVWRRREMDLSQRWTFACLFVATSHDILGLQLTNRCFLALRVVMILKFQ